MPWIAQRPVPAAHQPHMPQRPVTVIGRLRTFERDYYRANTLGSVIDSPDERIRFGARNRPYPAIAKSLIEAQLLEEVGLGGIAARRARDGAVLLRARRTNSASLGC